MAKIPFSKLSLKKVEDTKTVTINEQEIEVKQYLPAAEKLELIAAVLNNSLDQNSFSNPVKVEILGNLEIVYRYTNLSFTEKQKEDVAKLYDLLETNGVFEAIISAIPEQEYSNLLEDIDSTISAFYTYKNSALGILEAVSQDYSNLNLEASDIQQKLADGENITLLKNVMERLG